MTLYPFPTTGDRWTDLSDFGANPGALRARLFLPADLAAGAPLVVALHGCTQTAASYDRGTGWSTLAERAGFALLMPEQVRGNNPNGCFNWFTPADTARTGGEAESIAAMVRHVVAAHALDPARVFVTGLSAGGAMTAAMLAAWPELFAGGAIIGGLAYGDAAGVPDAMTRMRGQGGADDAGLVAAVRRAAPGFDGAWPSVSIWHGTADTTVAHANMDRLGRQWRGIHGVEGSPETTSGTGWTRQAWTRDGRVAVAQWSIAGMGHGVPIDPRGPDGLGAGGAHMLDVGVDSTTLIAREWGIVPVDMRARARPAPAPAAAPASSFAMATGFQGVQHTIETALRSAGLMR